VTSQINSWSGEPKSRGVSSIVFTLGVCVYNYSVNYENSLCGIASSKHVARVVAIMTEALEGSFSFDEFETSVIENMAAVHIFVTKVAKPMAILSTVQRFVRARACHMEMICRMQECYVNNRRVQVSRD
jgi:hypothetical protein